MANTRQMYLFYTRCSALGWTVTLVPITVPICPFSFSFFFSPSFPSLFFRSTILPARTRTSINWNLVVVSSIRANNKQLSRSLRMRLIKIAALTRRCSTIAVVGGYIIYAVPVERHNSWPVLHALYLARGTLLNRRLLPEKGSPNENPLCRIRLPTK